MRINKTLRDNILLEAGVWNELAHVENGNLHTAITSYKELTKLIDLAWELGYDQACIDEGR